MSAGHQLSDENRYKIDFILAKAGLVYYNRPDYKFQNKAIFTELSKINHKSEKLHRKAIDLFQKDKSFSPQSIENMASGEMTPQKWLSACALSILIEEKISILTFINYDDIFMLCAKPLLDHGLSKENTLVIIKPYAMELMQHINHYIERKEKHKKQER